MARCNPSPRHKKYIGIIGDSDPIENWGGIIYDAGHGPHLTYFQSYDVHDDEGMVSVYDFPIEDNVLEDLNWVKWEDVANYIGMNVDELKGYATSDNVFARADVYASVGSYHGFANLDSYPQEMTLKEANRKYGRAVAAAHRAEQRAREKARAGNPKGGKGRTKNVSLRSMFGLAPDEKETKELLALHRKELKDEKARLKKAKGKFQRYLVQYEIDGIEKTIRLLKARQAELQRSKKKNPRGKLKSTKRATNVRSLVARALK